MSLIKEALDKAQKKTTTGTSSEQKGSNEQIADTEPSADPRQAAGDDSSRPLTFLFWSGVVFATAILVGFELVYLLSLL